MANSNLVQALTRGLLIVEMLAESEAGLGVQAIAERLDVSTPAAHNLLRTLAARGWVERRERPVRYALGPQLDALAARAAAGGTRARVERVLSALAVAEPQVDWVFAELIDGEVVGTLRVERHSGRTTTSRGSPLGAYASASALTVQAWCGDPERVAFRRTHPFAEFGAGLWRDEAELAAFLAAARDCGHVAPPAPGGDVRVGVPILAAGGRLLGSLGAYWPCEPASVAETIHCLAGLLRRAQADIHATGERL